MFSTRKSPARPAIRAAVIETLEERRLLTTITGSGTIEYIDTEDQIVRLTYRNVTAELIFADSGAANLGDHVPTSAPDGTPGRDLFKIYVTQSDMDSYIAVARVPELTANARPMQPFDESLPKGFGIFSADDDVINGDDGTGSILLGARTGDADSDDGDRIAVISANSAVAIGLQPAGVITAGLEVINQQSLGQFLFGGTVLGTVNVSGNMDTFYAGWLLTGDMFDPGAASTPNFIIGGDIRNILSMGSIGTDSLDSLTSDQGLKFSSHFVADIGGYLGQIRSMTHDINGQVHVHHGTTNPSLNTPYTEIESTVEDQQSFTGFQQGVFNNPIFANNTPENAQFLGSFATPGSTVPVVSVQGALDPREGDSEDWYAISVMGGQTVTAQVSGAGVVVYDPDMRPIASNITMDGSDAFQFTATTPGVYRFQVFSDSATSYTLQANAGDIALGGVVAASGAIYDDASSTGFTTDRGDIGAVYAGGLFTSGGGSTIIASDGNIRTIQAGTIGQNTLFTYFGPSIAASGSVGLIKTTQGALGMSAGAPIGYNIQVVDSAGDVGGSFIANGAIGTIRGATVGAQGTIRIAVNTDNIGNDGVIDLISSEGNIGSFTLGGPVITTGAGGNVRYVHAGGTVYTDPFFGGGEPQEITYAPGQAVTLTDDSGAQVTLIPFSQPNPLYNPSDPDSQSTLGASLTVLTLPIRGSGGAAIVRVSVDGIPITPVTGSAARSIPELLTISTRGAGTANTAEIGEVVATGSGAGFVVDTRYPTGPNIPPRYVIDPLGARVLLTGPGHTDLLHFNGSGNFSSIINNSGGEIVNVQADTVGELRSATTLGLARSSTGAEIRPDILAADDVFPFSQQRIGVILNGDLMTAAAGRGVGNFRVQGSIISLAANADNIDVVGVFEGINAPIYAGGNINTINIGEGVLGSGTAIDAGSSMPASQRPDVIASKAGIYAQGRIATVIGRNADIRGAIASNGQQVAAPGQGTDPGTPTTSVANRTAGTGIGSITLVGGSIVNAFIGVVTDLANSDTVGPWSSTTSLDTLGLPVFAIGSINITGGGIIGSTLVASGINSVNVNGFGIFTSNFIVSGNSRIGSIVASGYGIRSVWINAGSGMNRLQAIGNGADISINLWSPTVKLSDVMPIDPVLGIQFDPYSGKVLGAINDLYNALGGGVSAANPIIPGITTSGVLEDVSAHGIRDLGGVSAYQIRSRDINAPTNPVTTPGGAPLFYGSELNFANSIGYIQTQGSIDGLQVVTGRLTRFAPATDVFKLGMTVAGPINNINIRGTLGNNSFINAIGPNGSINALTVSNDLVGSVFASSNIVRMNIGGNLIGNITIVGITNRLALGNLRVGGVLHSNSLNVNGNVGTITTAGSFGVLGDSLNISGNVNQIVVGTPRTPGSVLNSTINIGGNLGVLRVIGRIDSAVTVGGTLRNLQITANATGPNVLNAPIYVGATLNTARFVGGDIAANITAANMLNSIIGNIQIVNGNLQTGSIITSTLGSLNALRIQNGSLLGLVGVTGNLNLLQITNGNLFGSVGVAGRLGQAIISGNIGDGINPTSVTAANIGVFNTRSSILSQASVATPGPLTSLIVQGNVEAGAFISGTPIVRKLIRGYNNGTVIG